MLVGKFFMFCALEGSLPVKDSFICRSLSSWMGPFNQKSGVFAKSHPHW
jgi:hypothetical protein